MDTETWTLDELARRAGQALAADAVHAPNGRVRERPDGRAIRWYATIGLVDRPLTGPGRSARYGPRHLLQLVAVKRLQAQGRTLAEIQAELTGATDVTLRRVAELPHDTVTPAGVEIDADANRHAAAALPAPARFWATSPAQPDLASSAAPAASATPAAPLAERASAEPAHNIELASVRYQIALSDTVTLTLPHLPGAADLEAVRAAATSLLRLLADRGLTPVEGVHDEYHH